MDVYSNDFNKTVFSWSVSLRYQLVNRYDVSNGSSFFTYQCVGAETSEKGLSY